MTHSARMDLGETLETNLDGKIATRNRYSHRVMAQKPVKRQPSLASGEL